VNNTFFTVQINIHNSTKQIIISMQTIMISKIIFLDIEY